MTNINGHVDPIISVITVVYNDSIGIKKTLESVSAQTYGLVKHIVIDGGSIDGTVEILQEMSSMLYYWHSKPDKGLYDAMNLGIQAAPDCSFCYFLNAGDVFDSPDTLRLAAAQMFDPNALFFGCCIIHSRFAKWPNPGSQRHVRKIINRQDYPHHQSVFYPMSFLKSHKFDIRYRYIADIVLNTAAIRTLNIFHLDIVVTHSKLGGFSTGAQSWHQIRRYVEDELLFAEEERNLLLFKRIKIESKYFLKYLLSNLGDSSVLHRLMGVKHRILNG